MGLMRHSEAAHMDEEFRRAQSADAFQPTSPLRRNQVRALISPEMRPLDLNRTSSAESNGRTERLSTGRRTRRFKHGPISSQEGNGAKVSPHDDALHSGSKTSKSNLRCALFRCDWVYVCCQSFIHLLHQLLLLEICPFPLH